jgi:hypothetical protein
VQAKVLARESTILFHRGRGLRGRGPRRSLEALEEEEEESVVLVVVLVVGDVLKDTTADEAPELVSHEVGHRSPLISAAQCRHGRKCKDQR